MTAATTRPARSARQTEPDGFTLVELVVSVGILGVLMAAVTAALLVALQQNVQTSARLGDARDLRQTAVYFSEDVQGAVAVTTGTTPRCGADPAGAVVLETLGGSFDATALPAAPPATGAPQPVLVTYVRRAATVDGAAAVELHRLTCSSDPQTTPDSDLTLARQLSTGAPPAAAVSGSAVTLTLTARSGDAATTLVARRRTS